MAITTLMSATAKQEFMQGAHCFNGTVTPTATTATSFVLTALSSITGIAVGMAVSGTNVAAGSVVASIDSATQVTLSKATTGSGSSITMTFTGDQFKIALIKSAAATTYDSTFTNVGTPGSGSPTTTNLGTDEVGTTGYTAGGQVLASNTTPALGGSAPQVAYTTWSANPSWTSATISAIGCIIYNNSVRLGGAVNFGGGRSLGVFDFGGTQSVTAGTFTVLLPSASSTTAILRIA